MALVPVLVWESNFFCAVPKLTSIQTVKIKLSIVVTFLLIRSIGWCPLGKFFF